MSPKHLASALLAAFAGALLVASCAQGGPETAIESPPIETTDDDGDIGGDPDVGGSVGGDPAWSWLPPGGAPSAGDVGDPDPAPDTNSSGAGDLAGEYGPSYPVHPPGRQPPEPCEAKCEAEYEDAAVVCGRMENDRERMACQDGAHARYKGCRESCQHSSDDDPLERCKKACDKENERCIKNCPRGDQSCMQKCNEVNGRCLKECDKRYK